MKAYKGFSKDMTCRGFQFEEGKEYHEDKAELCKSGFHACENPLDCWSYYRLLDSEFHEVELDEVHEQRHEKDTKVCAKRIKIGKKLDIKGIVSASVDFIFNSIKNVFEVPESEISSGYASKIGSSGDDAQIGSSGRYAQIGSSGDYAKIECESDHAVVVCAGRNSRIKAPIGTWITLSEYGEWDGDGFPCVCVKSAQIDGTSLKPDTWYKLENGEFVEVTENEE